MRPITSTRARGAGAGWSAAGTAVGTATAQAYGRPGDAVFTGPPRRTGGRAAAAAISATVRRCRTSSAIPAARSDVHAADAWT
ncbi:hypothetical protein GCM10010171_20750 [Actinokineospora fastidiosa]|uniref:Uncharacterized protein n=1 Tax=Actinokineospora fastidiosa TaxID=1816 RepID=A0A918GAW8_9PSEU|nr:hypothetical protein GCM10010171_20750 [Actinokineospora fastidiosa]